MNITFTPEQEDALAARATANGKTPEALLQEFAESILAEQRRNEAIGIEAAVSAANLSSADRSALKSQIIQFIQDHAQS